MSDNKTVYRLDYTVPDYWVTHVDLTFDLDTTETTVTAVTTFERNPGGRKDAPLTLKGEALTIVSLAVNGTALNQNDYTYDGHELVIHNAGDKPVLTAVTKTNPSENTSLMGLYRSNDGLFTQCEAEGFRKITFSPDRPDVMATFTVTLNGDKETFPVLLSNGNLVASGDLPDNRHFAKWEDPFKKPTYLFALVAGRLVANRETYKLANGRDVLLEVWVEPAHLSQTQHAMDSLKHAIAWDESRFGLELDLERFMIVAVSDFNMGAMENKGLNVFNTRYVLADPQIATDTDYDNIEAVVGHEYFHNWTGNRVTCRDWFQLSLKEGLTVFRDQEFSADQTKSASGAAIKRIADVKNLRARQFPEDAGAMAHPVRPDSYEEINNFYTLTVYEKGAEVVRMYQTLFGKAGFRAGMDLYFKRHDGSAVTCRDFLDAQADANGADLNQFERWYAQSGTPVVSAETVYDDKAKTLTLKLSQRTPPTPGQDKKDPFLIPVAVGLVGSDGKDIAFTAENIVSVDQTNGYTAVFALKNDTDTFVLKNVPEKPVASLLRGFSAPVRLEYAQSEDDLLFLFANDSCHFNRWEAGQRYATARLTRAVRTGQPAAPGADFLAACRKILEDASLDSGFKALALTMPSAAEIAESLDEIDYQAAVKACDAFDHALATGLADVWEKTYLATSSDNAYVPTPAENSRRALKNRALDALVKASLGTEKARACYFGTDNMTERLAALTSLVNAYGINAAETKDLLEDFYRRHEKEALVVDKWFTVQAASPKTTVADVGELMKHESFTIKNPNRARSLIFGFCNANMAQFHREDGSGYRFWRDRLLEIDAINPQVAARLARTLANYSRYSPEQKKHARAALESLSKEKLSRDSREIIEKTITH